MKKAEKILLGELSEAMTKHMGAIPLLKNWIIEAMQEYARICCVATLRKAAEKAKIKVVVIHEIDEAYIDRVSITNHENIVLL